MESEHDQTDALDRKAAALARFASVVLSLSAVLGRELVRQADRYVAFTLFLVSLVSLVLAVGIAVRVLLPKEHLMIGMSYLESFPMWSQILKPRVQVQGETMDALVRVVAQERDINRKKARDVRIAFVLLFLGLVFIAAESILLASRPLSV